MSKAFRQWKAARTGPWPLCRYPLPKRLFTQRNYRMLRRRKQRYNKWVRKVVNNVNSDVALNIADAISRRDP